MKLSILVPAFALTIATSAHAATVGVSSAAALGANDSIDWSQLGASLTIVAGPASVTSAGGVAATVNDPGGILQRVDQGTPIGWNGNFADGTPLLWDANLGDITIDFSSPVYGVGAQIQNVDDGKFTATVTSGGTVYNLPGWSDIPGVGDGSAIFIGLLSDTAISSIVFHTVGAGGDEGFAIGPLLLKTVEGVPEPAAWALMIGGVGMVGGALRRRQRASIRFA